MENEATETIEPELWPSAVPKPKFEVTHSETFGALVGALAKAKLEYKPIVKQNENDAFTRGNRKSFYADLATYIDATQEALAKNGLVVLQWPDVRTDAKSMTLESILAHSSGEWMRGKLTLPAEGSQWKDGKHSTVFNPQTCGSAITYARRFTYAAIVGAAAEDDDGNSASGQGSKEAAQAVAQKKIADVKQKTNGKPSTEPVAALFYTEPPSHNGHYVEFINIREFLATREDIEDSLRIVFSTHKAKKTRDETALVPTSDLQPLLEKLVGEFGITVKKLAANA